MSDDLLRTLRRQGLEATDHPAWTAAYSSDASLYRIPPTAIAFPRDHDQVATAVAVCNDLRIPITARGAGTSVAGNAIGAGLVLDFSRHMNRVLHVDADSRTARVQPGVVHADLQSLAGPQGLRFGPDPSTHTRCTIGGMIGNDACGARSLAYGRTSDNVLGLTVVVADGGTFTTGYRDSGRPFVEGGEDLIDSLRAAVDRNLAEVRTEFGRFGRQVSGYALQNLAPERGFDLTRSLVGSEGTLAIVTEATVTLVPNPPQRTLVVLGFETLAEAGDATPAVLAFTPSACEGLDARIVDVVRRRKGPTAVPPLPPGRAWLLVELAGDDATEVRARVNGLSRAGPGISSRVLDNPAEAASVWRVREDGAGLAGRAPSGRPAYPGWEDAAVPPHRLGEYLRRFEQLLTEHDLTAMPFGHFGEGCIHVRLDFPFDRPDGDARFRHFVEQASDLVFELGGSNSGEHGDGRARGELLAKMYSPEALVLMAAVKGIFDPDNLLNPGVLIDPAPFDRDLRTSGRRAAPIRLAMAYAEDAGDFAQAVHRCTGVGTCRADNSGSGGVMCPSFAATQDEIHSTRGRARILQEVVNGASDLTWSSPEVHEALDLCLSCKGCLSDCPTGVDMATYKSEVLFQTYRRRPRPVSHYSLGWLPLWARMASRAPSLVNTTLSRPWIRKLALTAAGIDTRRSVPRFATPAFRRSHASMHEPGRPVVLFVDSFTDSFRPETARAALQVLRQAGYAPTVVPRQGCCGLTWITTGQLPAAKRRLSRTIANLSPFAEQGVPIVGLEPSCTAVLRHDAVELLATPAATAVASATRTLGELLGNTPGWEPPDLAGVHVVAQPHCHHHAVMGWDVDHRLLERVGAHVTRVTGCCGMAGNFGVERGHYEVSRAVAEQSLLPALRAANAGGADTVVLADGFSCQTQIQDLAGTASLHLAQLLSRAAIGRQTKENRWTR
jgi:FAD/FMN-containing dehydrogenase/Fe-S oxidoreductase